ncbi:MAG: universal stress protein [Deltaproteobacteria bacterium]|jgi:nucleotide-binding universal stress UspA family protein|nr:universal stress protein [Deltaproteobacteria bacterium]
MSKENSTHQIVVGFDFSDLGYKAIDHALSLAPLYGDLVLHVLGVLDSGKGLGPFGEDGKVDFHVAEKAQEEIGEVVKDRLGYHPGENIHHFVHCRIGRPAKELIGLADETGADLIVVGTHGRKGVTRLVMGSVAEKVVRHGTCPVLVVRDINHPDNEELPEALRPEPPCPQCVKARVDSDGKTWWCEVHSQKRLHPHPVSGGGAPPSGLANNWSRFNR